ncbi:MAG: polysaccharide pyruvyl transferase family protein [Lachnospiraceae bacterium]|nr:polysaccharide pyruvyl transferase family protein [Lachnospiraceae bacterium]
MHGSLKIGIITHWSSEDNYGQKLQCFALQQKLKMSGYDPYLIRYAPDKASETMKDKIIRNIKSFSLKRLMYLLSDERKKTIQTNKANRLLQEDNRRKNKERRFEEFTNKNINLSTKVYRSIEELRKDPPKAVAYICGSDQVWHDSYYEQNTAGWFLDFGNVPRISYAASIGRSIEEEEQSILKKYLSRFTTISVRERGALETCLDAGIDGVRLMPDPTILFESSDYEKWFLVDHADCLQQKYLFLYIINIECFGEKYWDRINGIATEKGLTLRATMSSGYIPAYEAFPGHPIELLTIPQWISAVSNAEYVVTSSFHGVVFSILHHKKFVYIRTEGAYVAANDRIDTLLNRLGIGNRDYTDEDLGAVLEKQIDWIEVDRKLSELRNEADDFIKRSLNDECTIL